jgi:hypothetical protein
MSLAPNWTLPGTEPDRDAASSPAASTACLHVGLQRPRVRCVDWTPCPLDLLPGATVARALWAAPPPSCALTGTGRGPEPVRIESAGRSAPMGF